MCKAILNLLLGPAKESKFTAKPSSVKEKGMAAKEKIKSKSGSHSGGKKRRSF